MRIVFFAISTPDQNGFPSESWVLVGTSCSTRKFRERLFSRQTTSIRKNPCWVSLDVSVKTFLCLSSWIIRSGTFYVANSGKGVAKHFFLTLTVRAPIGTVHFHI